MSGGDVPRDGRSSGVTLPLTRAQVARGCATGVYGLTFNSMSLFLVPLYARELAMPLSFVGWLIGAGALTPAVLSVAAGSLIDRFGPRRCFVTGAATSAVLALGFLMFDQFWELIGLQLLLGIARATAWIASQTYVSDIETTSGQSSLLGRFSFLANAGGFAGPLTAGLIAGAIGVRTTFAFVAGFALAMALLGLSLTERRLAEAATVHVGIRIAYVEAFGLLGLKAMRVAMLLSFARLWVNSAWLAFFPLLLVGGGVPTGVAGIVVASKSAVAAVSTLLAGMLARRFGAVAISACGLVAGAAGLAVTPFMTAVTVAWVPAVLVGLSGGLGLPLLLLIITRATPRRLHGVALGLRMTVNQFANTVAPVFTGAVVVAGLARGLGASATVAGVTIALASMRRLHTRPP